MLTRLQTKRIVGRQDFMVFGFVQCRAAALTRVVNTSAFRNVHVQRRRAQTLTFCLILQFLYTFIPIFREVPRPVHVVTEVWTHTFDFKGFYMNYTSLLYYYLPQRVPKSLVPNPSVEFRLTKSEIVYGFAQMFHLTSTFEPTDFAISSSKTREIPLSRLDDYYRAGSSFNFGLKMNEHFAFLMEKTIHPILKTRPHT